MASDRHPDWPSSQDFEPARFRSELLLPPAEPQLLREAASAVRQEYRSCSRWKRLNCDRVSLFAERDRGTIYVVHVDQRVEFDWTWEGAKAFRPQSLEPNSLFSDECYETAAYEEEIAWQGEILEVDEKNGCLFISLDQADACPTTGPFYVRPFEFLAVLDSLYNAPTFAPLHAELPARLAATTGGMHPTLPTTASASLPRLTDCWQHTWGILWGPPGTGKTWTTGQQVAATLATSSERILVVSTTNRATDAAALAIGEALRSRDMLAAFGGQILRVGQSANHEAFAARGLDCLLPATDPSDVEQIRALQGQLTAVEPGEEKAVIRKRIAELRSRNRDDSRRVVIDPQFRVVVATAFKATSWLQNPELVEMISRGEAPFTTVLMDEAGLISRAATAALSLLASQRVMLIGDSQQLAPISRIARVLPTRQQTWLASSGLTHLEDPSQPSPAVHVLSEQHRMHPDVCRVVSEYQYRGVLKTAPEVAQRTTTLPSWLTEFARAIWVVLDHEHVELASIRAAPGAGQRSWIRPATAEVLQKLLSDPQLRQVKGLFITPYRAQALAIQALMSSWGLENWEASTVHSQQGSEAPLVIFDTVSASSHHWPFVEWKRLVNVALSRAQEAVIVLASRAEMEEPFLRPLLKSLTPAIVHQEGDRLRWARVNPFPRGVPARTSSTPASLSPAHARRDSSTGDPRRLGDQFVERRAMTPILSHEQQRLTNLRLDGKPRLVRGVAGSGKSLVLCNWLAKTAQRLQAVPTARIWAVFANRSLHQLLRQSIESAWDELFAGELFAAPPFPWEKVLLLHARDVLADLLPTASLSLDEFEFDYDRAAEVFLARPDYAELLPRCTALFIDEAQDLGPAMLRLLLALVEQTDADDVNSRSAHIFYDNAQNIYRRKTPNWSEFGLDLRGRSTILRESFRSTLPITELAVNVLSQLTPLNEDAGQRELLELGLLEESERQGTKWWKVLYNQIAGPAPVVQCFADRAAELTAIAGHLVRLIQNEGVSPADICLLYNGKGVVQALTDQLTQPLRAMGVEVAVQTSRSFERRENTLLITTAHSFKGYDAEVVLIAGADQFVTGAGEVLAHSLYVAMTRARSILAVYGVTQSSAAGRRILSTLQHGVHLLQSGQTGQGPTPKSASLERLLETLDARYRPWLANLLARYSIRCEPLVDNLGHPTTAKPLFWFQHHGVIHACFAGEPPTAAELTSSLPYRVLELGAQVEDG